MFMHGMVIAYYVFTVYSISTMSIWPNSHHLWLCTILHMKSLNANSVLHTAFKNSNSYVTGI